VQLAGAVPLTVVFKRGKIFQEKHTSKQDKKQALIKEGILNFDQVYAKQKSDGHEHNGKTYHQPRNPFYRSTTFNSKN
jgi:hypothetical protein